MRMPAVGDHAEFHIRGTTRFWKFSGIVEAHNGGHLEIRRDGDGGLFRIPEEAIERFAFPNAGAVSLDTRTHSRQAELGEREPIGPLLSQLKQRSKNLRAFGEDGAPNEGVVEQVRSVRLLVEELRGAVVNDRHAKSLAALVEMIDASVPILSASTPESVKELRQLYEDARKRTSALLGKNRRGENRLHQMQRDIYGVVAAAESTQWAAICKRAEAHPHLVVGSKMTLNLTPGGEFLLPLRVALDNSEAPARGVRVVLDQHRGVEPVGNLPMIDEISPGKSVTVQARLMDRRRQGARDEVRVTAHLEYLGPNDELLRSTQHKITVRLRRPIAFEPLHNPFREFASGAPVDDPKMFFGRQELIEDIQQQLTNRPTGRCFALYGQKRTGKSSVIEQVRARLEREGALVATVSMGAVDRSLITESFVSEALDQLRVQVARRLDERTFERLLTRWPDQATISSQPLASFRRACTAARALTGVGTSDQRIVIVVDEFTYLYELLRRDHVAPADQDQLRDFMRQWKSLLESKTFSALVVGQDTMPYFLQAFPNEFSVMHTERLGYLTATETESLAETPIRRNDGSSRFTGYGLPRIHSYTAGHPYFTQILCDRIVSLANENKRSEISEFEVDAAFETLLEGGAEIGFHRFDCLLSADNTGVIVSETALSEVEERKSGDVALRVAHRIARLSGPQNKSVEMEALDLTLTEQRVLRDLVLREVITEREGRVQIKVLLFSEYLRRLSA